MTQENLLPAPLDGTSSVDEALSAWGTVEAAIQQEARGPYVGQARRALEVGLYDASVTYFWSATVAHLRKKVMAYGIEYFADQIGLSGLDTEEKLERLVSDYDLVDGCYRLGIINRHAHIQLQHCRDLRNHFTSTHPSEDAVDAIEAINFIKNCITYCLSAESPPPGLNPKNLIARLYEEDVSGRVAEIQIVLQQQATKMLDTLVHIFFSEYIKPDCSGTLKGNINAVAPICWEFCSQECKAQIGLRYARLVGEGTADEQQEAIRFLRQVRGAEYIP